VKSSAEAAEAIIALLLLPAGWPYAVLKRGRCAETDGWWRGGVGGSRLLVLLLLPPELAGGKAGKQGDAAEATAITSCCPVMVPRLLPVSLGLLLECSMVV
jgi:hypothetical protein